MKLVKEGSLSLLLITLLVLIMGFAFGLGFELFMYWPTYLFILITSAIMALILLAFE